MRTDVDALDSTGALHEHCKGVCMALPRDTKTEKSGCTGSHGLFAADELQCRPQ